MHGAKAHENAKYADAYPELAPPVALVELGPSSVGDNDSSSQPLGRIDERHGVETCDDLVRRLEASVLEIEKDEFVSRVRVGLPAYDEWLATSESARSFEALAKRSFTTMTLKLVERIFDAYAEGQLEKMVGSLPLAELGDVTKTTAAAAGTPAPKAEVV